MKRGSVAPLQHHVPLLVSPVQDALEQREVALEVVDRPDFRGRSPEPELRGLINPVVRKRVLAHQAPQVTTSVPGECLRFGQTDQHLATQLFVDVTSLYPARISAAQKGG